jgi:hypothetical protein
MAQENLVKGLKSILLLWPTRGPWQAVASVIGIGAVAIALKLAPGKRDHRVILLAAVAVIGALSWQVPAILLQVPYPIVTWQGLASGLVVSLLALGTGIAAWRHDRQALFVMGAGALTAIWFNLPFALVSKREQYHLLTLGAVLALSGTVQAVQNLRRLTWLAGLLLIMGTLPLAALAQEEASAFAPCASGVLQADRDAGTWRVVPSEIQRWIAEKQTSCARRVSPQPMSALPLISWGLYEEEARNGEPPYRWTTDRSVLLFGYSTMTLAFAARQPDATAQEPVILIAHANGQRATVILDSSDWKYSTVRFPSGLSAWIRSSQRLDLSISRSRIPASIDPSSSDTRLLGAQFRVVDVH